MEHLSKGDVIRQLRSLMVETGSIACLGCGFEHHCSVHGCRIMREAVYYLDGQEQKRGRAVIATAKDGKQIIYESVQQAEKELFVHHAGIYRAIKNGTKAAGMRWEYHDKEGK